MSSTKEKLGIAALILAFPVLIGVGILLHKAHLDKQARKRIADLDRAERDVGCDFEY